MSERGKWRGHTIVLAAPRVWVYESDQTPVAMDPDRPCGHCGLPDTPEGHDACLGALPGVMNACCGHGDVEGAYIQALDGSCIRGTAVLAMATKNLAAHEG